MLVLVLYPTLIAPLFNKFKPLDDDSLRARIEALLKRCGFAAKGVFVMDGSRRSAHGNAYFTGFGAAKRIVFFDTLLARLDGSEIEAVLAHELGHFKHRHVLKRLVTTFAISLIMLALLGWLAQCSWFYTGLGVTPWAKGNQALALILFFLVMPVFLFFASPLNSLTSRKHEFQADAFAASQTDAHDLVSALVKLYQDNASTLTPDPLYTAFYYSHPPASQRIERLLALRQA
jgi:STE24 endopeptidase